MNEYRVGGQETYTKTILSFNVSPSMLASLKGMGRWWERVVSPGWVLVKYGEFGVVVIVVWSIKG